MSAEILTPDEIVGMLQRSNLMSILVEGPVDVAIYRMVERRLRLAGGTFVFCSGRPALLAVYERRAEFANARCAFVADRDMWLFAAVPEKFIGVIFTEGYSIENDLLNGSDVERLFDEGEEETFRELLREATRWFAFEVEEFLAGRDPQVSVHLDRLITPGCQSLCEKYCSARGYRDPTAEMHTAILVGYRLKLRGKHLLDLLHRVLNAPKRSSRYSKANLIEIAAKSDAHRGLDALGAKIRTALGLT